MTYEHLATYLNDHLAGSVTVLELLPHLEEAHGGTRLERFFAGLKADVEADQGELEDLMARLGISESRPRQATAWLGEKVTQLKLKLDDPAGGALRLLEALEILSVGIEGKKGLWRALAIAAEGTSGLQGMDYDRLGKRAEEQRSRVEAERLKAARAALGGAA